MSHGLWFADQDANLFIIQLFYSFFKTLIGKTIVVELKNDIMIEGTLHAVDQYLNLKLTNISVVDEEKYPHLVIILNIIYMIIYTILFTIIDIPRR